MRGNRIGRTITRKQPAGRRSSRLREGLPDAGSNPLPAWPRQKLSPPIRAIRSEGPSL